MCHLVQVSKDEYDAFFKQTFKEFLEPLTHAHFNVEGTIEFTAMRFVPGMAPFEQQVRQSHPGGLLFPLSCPEALKRIPFAIVRCYCSCRMWLSLSSR